MCATPNTPGFSLLWPLLKLFPLLRMPFAILLFLLPTKVLFFIDV